MHETSGSQTHTFLWIREHFVNKLKNEKCFYANWMIHLNRTLNLIPYLILQCVNKSMFTNNIMLLWFECLMTLKYSRVLIINEFIWLLNYPPSIKITWLPPPAIPLFWLKIWLVGLLQIHKTYLHMAYRFWTFVCFCFFIVSNINFLWYLIFKSDLLTSLNNMGIYSSNI